MKTWNKTLVKDSLTLVEVLDQMKHDMQTLRNLIEQNCTLRDHKDFCIEMRKNIKNKKREKN